MCSLASYCKKRIQKGLPLTPVEERFFAQLVNVYADKQKQEKQKRFCKNVMPTMHREENVDCLLIPMKHLEPMDLVSFE